MKKTISVSQAISFVVLSSLSFNLWSQTEPTVQEPRVPLRAIERSSVLPTGIFDVDMDARLKSLKTVGIEVGTHFGVVEKWQGAISYDGVQFNDFAMGKTVTLGAKYNYLVVAPVSLTAEAKLPLHVGDGEIVREVIFGVPTVFFSDYVAGGILGDLFTLSMRPTVAAKFKFPVWFGAQIYGNLWADVNTTLATLDLQNSNNQAKWENTFFWKKLPVDLTLLYAFNEYVDGKAFFGFENALKADGISFGLGVTIRGGRLFS